jgi:hypothetical protein
MNRRSQRKSFNWNEFSEKMKWYSLIKPKVAVVFFYKYETNFILLFELSDTRNL